MTNISTSSDIFCSYRPGTERPNLIATAVRTVKEQTGVDLTPVPSGSMLEPSSTIGMIPLEMIESTRSSSFPTFGHSWILLVLMMSMKE